MLDQPYQGRLHYGIALRISHYCRSFLWQSINTLVIMVHLFRAVLTFGAVAAVSAEHSYFINGQYDQEGQMRDATCDVGSAAGFN